MTIEPSETDRISSVPDPDLAALFGELLAPERVDPSESSVRPSSLQRLDLDSAGRLRAFMQATEDGLGVTRFVYSELPILWVADRDGEILFAIEEIIDADSREFLLPRLGAAKLTVKQHRLGHPALLAGGPGRIGGEILFDLRAPSPTWYITNSSGRYGHRPDRAPEHLTNVARKFQEHGIILRELFIPRRP